MAKDDYFVIVYKILAYLYVQLKKGEDIDPKMLASKGPLMNIPDRYWHYIVENLQRQGYIAAVEIQTFFVGQEATEMLMAATITPDGIAYLCENSLLHKAQAFLKDVKEITPFI